MQINQKISDKSLIYKKTEHTIGYNILRQLGHLLEFGARSVAFRPCFSTGLAFPDTMLA